MSNYKPVIGLEIHIELKTASKMFCGCRNDPFGANKPNTHTCPVCLGLPGALPVPNKKAIEWTILIGQALNCTINKISKFDRKHYFYPDLPKGYQISQYDEPIAVNGILVIPSLSRDPSRMRDSNPSADGLRDSSPDKLVQNDKWKKFRIRRVHLEEDTGKLIHASSETLIDFNRSGVPLVEIVTEPDFDNSDDVKRFLEELHTIIRYLDVSDADMEKGSMRLEPNISVAVILNGVKDPSRMRDSNPSADGLRDSSPHKAVQNDKIALPNYKVEVKNINSFRFVKQAIDYEVKRQTEVLDRGENPVQETRGFNEKKQITYSQRTKEEAHDYRYFPEPDIPPMEFQDAQLKTIMAELPELPQAKLERCVKDFRLRLQDAFILTRKRETANYFEEVILKLKDSAFDEVTIGKQNEQQIANFIINKKIPTNISTDEFVQKAVEKMAVKTVGSDVLDQAIDKVILNNQKAVADFKSGKTNVIMFLVGQVMREMKGIVDAKIVREELLKKLK